jgi:hypothetical protein
MESGEDLGESRWIGWLCYSPPVDQTVVVFFRHQPLLFYILDRPANLLQNRRLSTPKYYSWVFMMRLHILILVQLLLLGGFQLLGKKWLSTQRMDDIPRWQNQLRKQRRLIGVKRKPKGDLVTGQFFLCRVFSTKCVQNLKRFGVSPKIKLFYDISRKQFAIFQTVFRDRETTLDDVNHTNVYLKRLNRKS